MEPTLLDALGKLWYNVRKSKYQTGIRIPELHQGRDSAHHTATVSEHTNDVVVR